LQITAIFAVLEASTYVAVTLCFKLRSFFTLIMLKLQLDRACFWRKEADANFSLLVTTRMRSMHNEQQNKTVKHDLFKKTKVFFKSRKKINF